MKRRDFIALLGSATAASAAWPLAVGAQTPPKIPRVGFIGGGSPAMAEHTFGVFCHCGFGHIVQYIAPPFLNHPEKKRET
jgi:hypothetical protein